MANTNKSDSDGDKTNKTFDAKHVNVTLSKITTSHLEAEIKVRFARLEVV